VRRRWVLGIALALMLAQDALAAEQMQMRASRRSTRTNGPGAKSNTPPAMKSDKRQPIVDRLPKMDPATEVARLQHWREVLKEVEAIPRSALSPKEQIDYDVYRRNSQLLIASERFREYEMPVNSDTAFWSNLAETAAAIFAACRITGTT